MAEFMTNAGMKLSTAPLLPLNVTSIAAGNFSSSNGAENQSSDIDLENDESPDMRAFTEVAKFVIPSIFGVIAVLGFIGNLLVIIVVVANKQMQSTTNILINSLALADLLFVVVCVPFTAVTFVVTSWPFGSFFCKLYGYVIFVTAHASVYTLVLMSLDRYLAVVHPIRSMTIRSERNAYLAIGIIWLIIGSANVPVFLEYDTIELPDCAECLVCTNVRVAEIENHEKVFYGFFFAFAFAIPLTVVSFLYGAMIRKLLYGGMPRPNYSTTTKASESMRAKRRVTKMVVIVVLIFAICWLPLQVIFLISSFGHYPDTVGSICVKVAFNCLAYMNSCVNPILYAFLSDNFRKSFRKVLGCFTGMGFHALRPETERSRDLDRIREAHRTKVLDQCRFIMDQTTAKDQSRRTDSTETAQCLTAIDRHRETGGPLNGLDQANDEINETSDRDEGGARDTTETNSIRLCLYISGETS